MPIPDPTSVLPWVGLAALLAAALRDLALRAIPHGAVLALAAAGLTARAAEGWGALGAALCGAAAVLAGGVLLWVRGWLGGGDAKLLAAAALAVPAGALGAMLLAVALAGGVLAAAYLALGRILRRAAPRRDRAAGGRHRRSSLIRRVARLEADRIRRGAKLPYGLAIAAGAGVCLVLALPDDGGVLPWR